jgi:hypothetical protein
MSTDDGRDVQLLLEGVRMLKIWLDAELEDSKDGNTN